MLFIICCPHVAKAAVLDCCLAPPKLLDRVKTSTSPLLSSEACLCVHRLCDSVAGGQGCPEHQVGRHPLHGHMSAHILPCFQYLLLHRWLRNEPPPGETLHIIMTTACTMCVSPAAHPCTHQGLAALRACKTQVLRITHQFYLQKLSSGCVCRAYKRGCASGSGDPGDLRVSFRLCVYLIGLCLFRQHGCIGPSHSFACLSQRCYSPNNGCICPPCAACALRRADDTSHSFDCPGFAGCTLCLTCIQSAHQIPSSTSPLLMFHCALQRGVLDVVAVSLGCVCSLRAATERLSRDKPRQWLFGIQYAVLLAAVALMMGCMYATVFWFLFMQPWYTGSTAGGDKVCLLSGQQHVNAFLCLKTLFACGEGVSRQLCCV